jgi:ABC-type lipoprotein release transport system permease subunit
VSAEIFTAAISLVGTLVGTLGGIALSSNLTNYRIEQLEKKVEKHNNLITRTYKLEQDFAVMDERVRVANHRIEDLEKEEMQHEG